VNMFNGVYQNKTVLVTGHLGFKGSWLVFWLKELGANVSGLSLLPNSQLIHSQLLDLQIDSEIGDIRDTKLLDKVFNSRKPDIVFHLAAQSLVIDSYIDPINTYTSNILGTINILEACKKYGTSVLINITSDKAYKNLEQEKGYVEEDSLGGKDPYSCSKSCADLIAASYMESFFQEGESTLVANCRSGNVIGGGDWSRNRLFTDIVESATSQKVLSIRNPNATRPWQHVLDPLSGYLVLGEKLINREREFVGAWNFGPTIDDDLSVQEVIKITKRYWNSIEVHFKSSESNFHESQLLRLDCSKAENNLGWSSVWGVDKAIERTINWYKSFYSKGNLLTRDDFSVYIQDAKRKNMFWT